VTSKEKQEEHFPITWEWLASLHIIEHIYSITQCGSESNGDILHEIAAGFWRPEELNLLIEALIRSIAA